MQEVGKRWATISERMGGRRSENDVKNHYYAKKRRKGPGHAAKRRKKEAEGGYVPVAHKPRTSPRAAAAAAAAAAPMPLPVAMHPLPSALTNDQRDANEAVNV